LGTFTPSREATSANAEAPIEVAVRAVS
jgi:hypothetical protein